MVAKNDSEVFVNEILNDHISWGKALLCNEFYMSCLCLYQACFRNNVKNISQTECVLEQYLHFIPHTQFTTCES